MGQERVDTETLQSQNILEQKVIADVLVFLIGNFLLTRIYQIMETQLCQV